MADPNKTNRSQELLDSILHWQSFNHSADFQQPRDSLPLTDNDLKKISQGSTAMPSGPAGPADRINRQVMQQQQQEREEVLGARRYFADLTNRRASEIVGGYLGADMVTRGLSSATRKFRPNFSQAAGEVSRGIENKVMDYMTPKTTRRTLYQQFRPPTHQGSTLAGFDDFLANERMVRPTTTPKTPPRTPPRTFTQGAKLDQTAQRISRKFGRTVSPKTLASVLAFMASPQAIFAQEMLSGTPAGASSSPNWTREQIDFVRSQKWNEMSEDQKIEYLLPLYEASERIGDTIPEFFPESNIIPQQSIPESSETRSIIDTRTDSFRENRPQRNYRPIGTDANQSVLRQR